MGNLRFPLQLIINFSAGGPACLLDARPSHVPAPGYLFGPGGLVVGAEVDVAFRKPSHFISGHGGGRFPEPAEKSAEGLAPRAAYDCAPDSVRLTTSPPIFSLEVI